MIIINQNTPITSNHRTNVDFTGVRMNMKSVRETLCSDYFEKQISPFDNPLFYKYLSKDSKKLNSLLDKLYRRKLPKYDEILKANNIDKKHRVLLADPEVTSHIDELAEFVTTSKIDTKKVTPFQLRKSFSDYLGTETIYRGLNGENAEGLTETLQKDGIRPKISTEKKNIFDSLNYYLSAAGAPALSIFARIEDIIRGKKNTEFMSVSKIYDVAASVGKNGSNNPKTPVIVTKAEVPKLSVIKQKGDFSPRRSIDKDVLIIGDKKYSYETQREEIEAFIPFHISTKNAEFKTDTTTPDYRWGI